MVLEEYRSSGCPSFINHSFYRLALITVVLLNSLDDSSPQLLACHLGEMRYHCSCALFQIESDA